jgi:hypothetical protein
MNSLVLVVLGSQSNVDHIINVEDRSTYVVVLSCIATCSCSSDEFKPLTSRNGSTHSELRRSIRVAEALQRVLRDANVGLSFSYICWDLAVDNLLVSDQPLLSGVLIYNTRY